MRDQTKVFLLDPSEWERSGELLESEYTTRVENLLPEIQTFYDTFDWRLFRKRLSLGKSKVSDQSELQLRSLQGQFVSGVSCPSDPSFVWDLPKCSLRERLAPIVQMRRLLPLVQIGGEGTRFDILNSDRKTVARVLMKKRNVARPWAGKPEMPLPASLQIVPIRGYESEHIQIVRFVDSHLPAEESVRGELELALESVERTPLDYSSKLRVSLEPTMPAGEAARKILCELLDVLLVNEKGTRLDLDSEFLHDFRVAIRRTRAALAQLKAVIAPEVRDRFRPEFSWLGSTTGPSRDLDVYLLKMPDYRKSLPNFARGHLDPLTDFLVREKAEERKRLVAALDSGRYRNLVKDWKAVLQDPGQVAFNSTAGPRPIHEIASKRIWKIYRRVLKMGLREGGSAEAEVLHQLRIECKKLRYMMEFFRSLYTPREIKGLIRTLRRLQDNLGDFNDCEVQQLKLKEFARTMMSRGGFPPETFMALGCLVERLETSQQEELDRFSECFREFSRPENQEHFRSLFGPKKKPA